MFERDFEVTCSTKKSAHADGGSCDCFKIPCKMNIFNLIRKKLEDAIQTLKQLIKLIQLTFQVQQQQQQILNSFQKSNPNKP
jgi:hypothetical protein